MLSFVFPRTPSLARVGSPASFRRVRGGTGRAAVDFHWQLAISNVGMERFVSMALRMASNQPLQLARLLDSMPSAQYQATRHGDKRRGAAPIYAL
jgi:hypothetical protein